MIMKPLNQYIQEKLIINKDYKDYRNNMIVVKSFDELRKIIEDRYDKLGAGTKQDPIDFNDIDVSNLYSFYNRNRDIGIFERTQFKYIDISDWDVSNVKSMQSMFYDCEALKSVGDISKWDVSNVTDMMTLFYMCKDLKSVGDISNWDVSSVTNMAFMFCNCVYFNQDISKWDISKVSDMEYMFKGCKKFNQDISKWNVSKVYDMSYMFAFCKKFNQDISGWDVSKVMYKRGAFDNCPIKDEYKPKFK